MTQPENPHPYHTAAWFVVEERLLRARLHQVELERDVIRDHTRVTIDSLTQALQAAHDRHVAQHSEIERLRADVQFLAERIERDQARASDLAAFCDERAQWSVETFGPGDRYAGVIAHIRKELNEIEAAPDDLEEWIDVILLALDGAFRSAGADGREIVAALVAKHEKNRARRWPDWRTLSPGEVSEHLEEGDHG